MNKKRDGQYSNTQKVFKKKKKGGGGGRERKQQQKQLRLKIKKKGEKINLLIGQPFVCFDLVSEY